MPRPARAPDRPRGRGLRSEEHTSELQSRLNLVCRLLLEKKKAYQASQLESPYLLARTMKITCRWSPASAVHFPILSLRDAIGSTFPPPAIRSFMDSLIST